jgi:hypothetical protein
VNLHEFSDWLSNTPFSQAIQITSWAIPSIQVVHISLCGAVRHGADVLRCASRAEASPTKR